MPSSTVAAYYSNTKPREIEIRIKQQQSWSGPIALAPTESQRLRMAGALSGFIDNYNVNFFLWNENLLSTKTVSLVSGRFTFGFCNVAKEISTHIFVKNRTRIAIKIRKKITKPVQEYKWRPGTVKKNWKFANTFPNWYLTNRFRYS